MDSATVKQSLMKQINAESSVANARVLIEKLQENCFEKCIPKPGTALSSGETTCMTTCLEKYMTAWNLVNTTFINRLQQENSR